MGELDIVKRENTTLSCVLAEWGEGGVLSIVLETDPSASGARRLS